MKISDLALTMALNNAFGVQEAQVPVVKRVDTYNSNLSDETMKQYDIMIRFSYPVPPERRYVYMDKIVYLMGYYPASAPSNIRNLSNWSSNGYFYVIREMSRN